MRDVAVDERAAFSRAFPLIHDRRMDAPLYVSFCQSDVHASVQRLHP
jgi:hypothetical protein